MHTFKQLLLVSCCITTATFCQENQPPVSATSHEFHSGKTHAGILELNRKYYEISEGIQKNNELFKASHAQQEKLGKQLQTALIKATRTGWPFTARLLTVGLAAFIAWEHKDKATKETLISSKDAMVSAWDNKETIMQTIKESFADMYLKLKKGANKLPITPEQKPVVQEASVFDEASQRQD